MKQFHAYIAKKNCGCISAACVDKPEYAKDTARDVMRWIKDGYTVERIFVTEATPLSIRRCDCEIKQGVLSL